jgi:hypothetical protein
MSNQVVQNSLMTIKHKIELANNLIQDWSTSNTYVGIGGQLPYLDAEDDLIPVPNNSIDYLNNVYRNLVALKKITAADMTFVVPRVDWQAGLVYDQYDNQVDMFTTIKLLSTNGTIDVSNSSTIIGNSTSFFSNFSQGTFIYLPGDGELVAPQIRQVVNVSSNTVLTVNTAFSGNFVSNTAFVFNDTAPKYAKNFYVRNTFDQVFVCLFNNFGIVSAQMPQISIGGDLPEDATILTSDGYQWKYLYSIPSGQKQLFFSPDWMPVFKEADVVESAVSGRIDVVLIQNGGSGYNGNIPSNSATILTVTGDGAGANLTAIVDSNGSITGVNILNGGQKYTQANVLITSGTTGIGGNLRTVISPAGGHGFNPIEELGASGVMLSMELVETEGGTIPTGASVGTGTFNFRQISIIKNPLLSTSGKVASNLNYSTVYTITVQPLPTGQFFSIDETVYQGLSLDLATFSGTVVFWDDVNNILWLNNVSGEFNPQSPIVGTQQTVPVTAFIETPPVIELYSGLLLHINNVLPVVRGANQTEQVRVIFNF